MEKFIFLTKTENMGEIEYFAIAENQIETLNVSDTYLMDGQTVGSSEAGDYLTLYTQKAVNFANEAYHSNHAESDDTEMLKHFNLNDTVSAYNYDEFDEILESDDLEKDVDFTVEYTTCKGFSYWDGYHDKTIIIQSDIYDNLDWQIETDKLITKRLRTAISKMKEVSKGVGCIYYKHGSVNIYKSYCYGTWENYRLTID